MFKRLDSKNSYLSIRRNMREFFYHFLILSSRIFCFPSPFSRALYGLRRAQAFKGTFALVIVRMNKLSEEKEKKSITAFIIEKSIELLGCTPDEKSDENLKWMCENGYGIKQVHKRSL